MYGTRSYWFPFRQAGLLVALFMAPQTRLGEGLKNSLGEKIAPSHWVTWIPKRSLNGGSSVARCQEYQRLLAHSHNTPDDRPTIRIALHA